MDELTPLEVINAAVELLLVDDDKLKLAVERGDEPLELSGRDEEDKDAEDTVELKREDDEDDDGSSVADKPKLVTLELGLGKDKVEEDELLSAEDEELSGMEL